MNYDKVFCFGLTEPEFGSDATSLQTSATKTEGGFLINGKKRWIGNTGYKGYMNVWARDKEDKKIKGYVVDLTRTGVNLHHIKEKQSLKGVGNYEIHFKDVFVPVEDRLA